MPDMTVSTTAAYVARKNRYAALARLIRRAAWLGIENRSRDCATFADSTLDTLNSDGTGTLKDGTKFLVVVEIIQ